MERKQITVEQVEEVRKKFEESGVEVALEFLLNKVDLNKLHQSK